MKTYNSSIKLANILINAWKHTDGDVKVKEEKAKHYYDALTRYLCPVSGLDIEQTWDRILNFLKKEEIAQVHQLVIDLMAIYIPSSVREVVERDGSYDRKDERDVMELSVKESDEMLNNAFGYDGEFCFIVDHAIKLDENIMKIEASDWSVNIGDGDECKTKLATFPPLVKTQWLKIMDRTFLYLIKEKRLIEI